MEQKAIVAEELTKFYGKARGIDRLNLSVGEGEFFGFIGPNGAGKSTTIRTLLGLISPNSGKGQVLGLDIGKDRKAILEKKDDITAWAVKADGTVKAFQVSIGTLTDAERQILVDGCLINYYRK